MKTTAMFKIFFMLLMVLPATSIAFAADDTHIRLAVLAEDVSSESRALADLLTADLSKTAGVQVVERSEIDRVLAEQKISAAGLVETASRIQLGRLLKADGLVLIQKDVARKTRILARLVETKNGFLAGYYQYPFANVPLGKIAQDTSSDIRSSIPKLHADPAKMQRIAIARIGNATLRRDYDWLESDLPVLLAMTFSAEPGVLLMERRQLGEALNEATLTGDKSALKTGNVLIDGEVALIYGQIPKDGVMPVSMTLRFRDATLKEIGRVSREGRLADLDKVSTETMASALVKLHEIGQRPAGQASAEPEMLLKMAKRHGYVWAADAAYALSPTNIAAKNELVSQLINECVGMLGVGVQSGKPPEYYLEKGIKLAWANQLCIEENRCLFDYTVYDQEHNIINFLAMPETMFYAETSAVLKPVRETCRRKIEARRIGDKPDFGQLLEYSPAFFDNPLDYFFYSRSIYEDISRRAKSDEERRKAAVYVINRSIWPPELYLDMAESPDPVIRYFALTKLMRFYGNIAKQRQYASQAAECFNDVLDFTPCLAKTDPYISKLSLFFQQTTQDIKDACPNLRRSINTNLYTSLNKALDKKDYHSMLFLGPERLIPQLPMSNSVPLADRILAERESFINNYSRLSDPVDKIIKDISEWRMSIQEKSKTDVTNDPVSSISLISSKSQDWLQSGGRVTIKASSTGHYIGIAPQMFLIDGDTMWLGLASSIRPNKVYATGLMKFDLPSGHMLSCRYGTVEGDDTRSYASMEKVMLNDLNAFEYKSVISIFQSHNHIVVGQKGIGVLLYPIQADITATDLSGVTIIDKNKGLIANNVFSVQECGDRLFILASLPASAHIFLLFEWSWQTRKLKLLWDSKKEFTNIQISSIKSVPDLTVNQPQGNVQLNFLTLEKSDNKKDRPIKRYILLTYDLTKESWNMTTNAVPEADKSAHEFKPVLPKNFEQTYDVQNYNKGTLAITGYANNWNLVYFYTKGDETAVRLLKTKGISVSLPARRPLVDFFTAASTGNIPFLQRSISEGISINLRDDKGYTLLIYAIDDNQSETALWLIRQGADITLSGRDGGTPLTYAAWRDQTNVVSELLARNADPNTHFNNGQTPLMLASANGNLDMVKQLIDKGARTTSMDKQERTALTWSVYAPNPDVLNYFLQRTPVTSTLNATLYRAIQWGCNQTNNIAILLKHGADIHTDLGITSYTLSDKAAMYSEPETLQFLIDNGANVNYRSTTKIGNKAHEVGYPTLMNAAMENRADNIRVLLRAGADLFKTTSEDDYNTVFSKISHLYGDSRAEARAVLLEALGQYILRTGNERPY